MSACVIYTRISRDLSGTEFGVATQEKECRDYAAAKGWDVLEVFTDNDVSAFSGANRPGFNAMIDRVKAGGVSIVLAWHIDRLYRRTTELAIIIDLVKEHGVAVRTVKAGDLDLSNAQGILMAEVAASIAGYEVRHQIERQKASHIARATQGRWRGGPIPYGYRRGAEKGSLEIVPEQAAVLRSAASDVLAGRTLLSIVKRLNSEGITPPRSDKWRAGPLRRLLINPTIAGLVSHNGSVVGKAQWEPILDEDEHQGVKSILQDPARLTHAGGPRKWQGSGLYVCGECGATMKTGKSRSKTSKSGRAYVCREHQHVVRSLDHVDELVDQVIVGYLSQPENQIKIRQNMDNEGQDLDALLLKKRALEERKSQLGSLFARGSIDEDQLVNGTEEIKSQILKIDKDLADLRQNNPVMEMVLSEEDLMTVWRDLPGEVRHNIIKTLVTVVIHKAPPGVFQPQYVEFQWK